MFRNDISAWSCLKPDKIVQTRYMNTDTHDIFEARFSLDEINTIKCKVGNWYFIEFSQDLGKEYALPKNIIENNFNIVFKKAETDDALVDYYRVGL
jgi:hypothetical protein